MPSPPSIQLDEDVFLPNAGGQQAFMDDFDHTFVALAGGWYAGKTWAGARKTISLHVHNAIDDDGQPTFVKGLVVAQNYSLARQVNIPEIMLACDEAGLPYRWVADPKRYCFEFPDLGTKARPSELLIRSADSPETINAFTVGHLWGDEVPRWPQSDDDPKRDALLQAKGRLRDPRAKVLQANFTFTHEGDDTRVYRDFEEKPLPQHVLYRAGTFDNPSAAVFAETMRGQLTEELADQYLAGMAASFRGGKVYRSFDYDLNTTDQIEPNPHAPLHLAMDFNINPGMHGIIGQHDESTDTAYAIDELHGKDMSAIQMLPAFKSWVSKNGGWHWPELHVFGDASGSGRFEATGESAWKIVREWFDQNMPNVPIRYRYRASNPGVADRVNAVNCALRTIDGKVRYRIHRRCDRLVTDMKSLKWHGNEINKKDRKLSHASDADGYRIERIMPIRRSADTSYQVGIG